MTEAQIRKSIEHNQEKITSYNSLIEKEEDYIFDLDALYRRITSLGTKFEDAKAERTKVINNIEQIKKLPKSAKSYTTGMHELLGERETTIVSRSLFAISRKAKLEMQKSEKHIEELKAEIRTCNNTIIYLKEQLMSTTGTP